MNNPTYFGTTSSKIEIGEDASSIQKISILLYTCSITRRFLSFT